TIRYGNQGNVDMAAPLFDVSVDANLPVFLINRLKGIFSSVSISDGTAFEMGLYPLARTQVMGLNQDGPPGILPPGASYEIPIEFDGAPASFEIVFHLGVLRADNTLIDWNPLELALRPSGMSLQLWAAIWNNFKANIGTTWADYLRALGRQSQLMALG